MRIALLTFEYPDVRPGGVGSYVYKCALSLAAAGHEAHIFTLPVPPAMREALPAGVHLHAVPDVAEKVAAGGLPGPLGAVALNGELAGYKLAVGALLTTALRYEHMKAPFDLVEAAEYEALGLPLILKPIRNLPVVVQIHLGTAVNVYGNDIPVNVTDHLAEALELASILGADAVYAATQSIVDVTRRVTPFERPVEVIPYPISIPTNSTPTPLGGPVLFVGRLQKRKGCDVLASAASIFLQKNPEATIRIAGADTNTGPNGTSMWQEMLRRIDPKVHGRFVFLGELPQEEVRRELSGCRFQVIPSIVENFANTAIDAFAAGRAIVYTGNTGLDDVVGDAGLRVWPLNAETLAAQMQQAWTDDRLIAEYSGRASQRVRMHFPIKQVTRRRISFYEKCIRECAQRGNRPAFERLNRMTPEQIGCVLNALADILHSCVGVEGFVSTPGRLLTAYLERLRDELGRVPTIWLFGAGRHTTRLMGERFLWESHGLALAGIIDDHARFNSSSTYLGLPVRSSSAMEAALSRGERVDSVILSTDTLQELFWTHTAPFRALGVTTVKLF